MLDMGFAEDIEAILAAAPDGRQTVLFSATMPPRIDAHRRAGTCSDPVRIAIERATPASPARRRTVRQTRVRRRRARTSRPRSAACSTSRRRPRRIVFCRTRDEVDQLTETLNGRGYRAEALHGGMTQEQRDRVMGRLRAGRRRPAGRHRRRRPRARHRPAHPRRQLRRAVARPSPTSTASAASAGPGARASRSRSPSRASTGCSRRSSGSPGSGSRSRRCPTVADLRARRLELTRAALDESLLEPTTSTGSASSSRRWPTSTTCVRGRPGRGEARARGGGRPATTTSPRSREVRAPRRRCRRAARRKGAAAGPAARAATRAMTRLFVGAGRSAGHPPAGPRRRDRRRVQRHRPRRSARSRSPTASRSSRCREDAADEVITRAARRDDQGQEGRPCAASATPASPPSGTPASPPSGTPVRRRPATGSGRVVRWGSALGPAGGPVRRPRRTEVARLPSGSGCRCLRSVLQDSAGRTGRCSHTRRGGRAAWD